MIPTNNITWTESVYNPRFEIKINGSELENEMLSAISDLTIEEKLDEGLSFSFKVNYEIDTETQERPWLDDELFDLGNKVNIKIGYNTNMSQVLMGSITGLETEISKDVPPFITVRGHDLAYDYLKRKSPTRTFLNLSYSDIVQTLAEEGGLTAQVETTGPVEGIISKCSEETYFAFIQRLAGEVSYKLRIEGETLYFTPPEDEEDAVFILEYGRDIVSMTPTLNTSQLCTEVEVRGIDINDPTTPIIGTAETGSEQRQEPDKKTASQIAKECFGDLKVEITNVVVPSAEEANAIAKDILNQAGDNLIQAEVKCIGTSDINTGMCISIQKVGKRFSGKYFVTSVTHTFNKDGFLTDLVVKRNAL